MALSTGELLAQRKTTAAFIMADVEELILTPRTKTSTGTGAYTWTEGTPRPIQYFKLIWLSDRERPTFSSTSGGSDEKADLMLLGLWDSQGEIHDIFTLADGRWGEIIAEQPGYGYERKWLAVLRG